LADLDWPLIQGRDFRRAPNDPGKLERRAAECLVYRHAPITAILRIACKDTERENSLLGQVTARQTAVTVMQARQWYF
jgi:hypothetical protein